MTLTATSDQAVSCCFGRDLSEVKRARGEIRKALYAWGLVDHVDLAELVLSELVTNAIRHGKGPVEVCFTCAGGYLYLDVHDDGPGRPVRRHVTANAESGRGLEVVDGLLTQEGGRRTVLGDETGAGKTVRAALWVGSHC